MGKHLIRILLLAVTLGALTAPAVASAQSVIVLGLRSAEGDDEFANNLSGALRNAASRVNGWELNTREVSLAQMTLAHGCDAADVGCVQDIGNTLGVRFVIYGNVRRTSTQAEHDYSLSLYMFDTESGSISNQITDTIPRVQTDIDDLREKARGYISQFSGAERTGTIRIQVNLAAAEVYLDGESLGTTTGGAFETTVSTGQHQIEVRAEGHNTFRGTVTVVADDVAALEVELVEGDEDEIIVGPDDPDPAPRVSDGGGANWPAIISFGLGGVGLAMTIVSWVIINGTSSDLEDSRRLVGQDLADMGMSRAEIEATNACDYMRENPTGFDEGISLCDQGDLWQAMQYVFIAVTGVALTAGIVFLVLGGDDEEEAPAVSLLPSFGPNRGSLTARLSF